MFRFFVPVSGLLTEETPDCIRYTPTASITNSSDTKLNDGLFNEDDNLVDKLKQLLKPSIDFQSYQGVICRGIPVLSNHLYRLRIDCDIKWNASEHLAPTIKICLEGSSVQLWSYIIPSKITCQRPILEATIFIPDQINIVHLCLMVEIPSTSTYQLIIHRDQCIWEPLESIQHSISLPLNQRSVQNRFGLEQSTLKSPILSYVDRVFLTHSLSVSYDHTLRLHQQLMNYHIPATISENNHNLSKDLPHSPVDCAHCCLKYSEKQEVSLPSVKAIDRNEAEQLLTILNQALMERLECIMVINDSSSLHKDWHNQLTHVLSSNLFISKTNEHKFNVCMLGSRRLKSDGIETTIDVVEENGNGGFYRLDMETVYSTFSFLLQGTEIIQQTKEYLTSFLAQKDSKPMESLHLFWYQLKTAKSIVRFPSLVISNHKLDVKLLSDVPEHFLYWDRQRYGDMTSFNIFKPLDEHIQNRTIHVFCVVDQLGVVDNLKKMLMKQTYKKWILHIISSHVETNQKEEEKIMYHDKIQSNQFDQLIMKVCKPMDWITWLDPKHTLCPWRLAIQVCEILKHERTATDIKFITGISCNKTDTRCHSGPKRHDVKTIFGLSKTWQEQITCFSKTNPNKVRDFNEIPQQLFEIDSKVFQRLNLVLEKE